MEDTEKHAAWAGEFNKDTVTYRFIELSMTALEAAFESDEGLFDKYAEWMNTVLQDDNPEEKQEEKQEEAPSPVMLYEFTSEDESTVRVYAIPKPKEFFVLFRRADFETSVSLLYDTERMDIDVARIVKFSGNTSTALAWAEAFKAMLDDMLVGQMQGNEEE